MFHDPTKLELLHKEHLLGGFVIEGHSGVSHHFQLLDVCDPFRVYSLRFLRHGVVLIRFHSSCRDAYPWDDVIVVSVLVFDRGVSWLDQLTAIAMLQFKAE